MSGTLPPDRKRGIGPWTRAIIPVFPLVSSLVLGLAPGLPSGIARAQETLAAAAPTLVATRPQLIEAARAAHKAGDHLRAAALYRHAAEVAMDASLGWALALEQEEAGALADSYLNAQQCAREASADRKLVDRDRILRDCQDLVQRLGPKVGYLVIEMPGRQEGVDVSVVGQTAGKLALGVAYVVTPGSVTVKAKAIGRIVHWENVDVAAGQTKIVRLELTPMPDGAGPLTAAQKLEIKSHYQRASRDYDLGKFDEAIDEYQVIYEIDGDPVMLYNLAQAYRLAEQPEKAIQFYRRYLLRAPEARNREAVEQKIEALAKVLADHGKAAPPIAP
jgi:tetratricopeptide (TPR) repeat protein